MNTIGKRIAYLVETKGLNMSEFCEKYDFIYSAFTPIANDKRPLGMNILKRLVEVFPTLNINWLIYGNGEINYNIKDIANQSLLLQEPPEHYGEDILERLFIEQLSKKGVRKALNKIIKEVLDKDNIEILENTEDFILRINPEKNSSELIQKIEKLIEDDLTSHELPNKNEKR